jgi:hypothetical protein
VPFEVRANATSSMSHHVTSSVDNINSNETHAGSDLRPRIVPAVIPKPNGTKAVTFRAPSHMSHLPDLTALG